MQSSMFLVFSCFVIGLSYLVFKIYANAFGTRRYNTTNICSKFDFIHVDCSHFLQTNTVCLCHFATTRFNGIRMESIDRENFSFFLKKNRILFHSNILTVSFFCCRRYSFARFQICFLRENKRYLNAKLLYCKRKILVFHFVFDFGNGRKTLSISSNQNLIRL